MRTISFVFCLGAAALSAPVFAIPVAPPVIPIAVSGYNQDVIVEAGAPAAAAGVTTVTMDSGTGNTGATWYEQGYNSFAPTTGIPAHGTTIISAAASDHSYKFANSYGPGNGAAGTTNDAFVVGQGAGSPIITLAIPAAYSRISLLGSAGHGPNSVSFTIQFTDASTQTGFLTAGDWFNGTPAAYSANGRVTVNTGSFDNVNTGNPRLYTYDITVNSTMAIQSVTLNSTSTTSTAAFFALSGSPIVVPEPSTSALLLLALLVGLGATRLRARRTM